jgi:serine/threonine protein kinase
MHEGFLKGQDVFQRYRIISQLGAGGFGAVFKAEQATTQQHVAIKVLITGMHGPHNMREEQQKRFWREVALTGKLSNPHTVRLIDSGFMPGTAWQDVLDGGKIQDARALETIKNFVGEDAPVMVLELVQGQSLRDILRTEGQMPPARARRICGQVLESLAEAHALGIVHRDLKPENIMLVGSGKLVSAKVLDFGISGVIDNVAETASLGDGQELNVETITRQGQVRGTLSYMAPEQLVMFSQPRIETDIYAMGLILLECLTGNQAMTGNSSMDICRKQMQEDPEIPKHLWDIGLGSVIAKATHKNPDLRFSSAEEMFSAINIEESSPSNQSLPPVLSTAQVNAFSNTAAPVQPLASQSLSFSGPIQTPLNNQRIQIIVAILVVAIVIGSLSLVFVLNDDSESNSNMAEAALSPPPSPQPPPTQPATAINPPTTHPPATHPPTPPPQEPAKNINALLDLGKKSYSAGFYQDAQTHFQAALLAQKNHPEALAWMGRCAVALKDWPAANNYLQQAIIESQDPVPALLELSDALHQQEKTDEAKAVLERYLQAFPDHPRASDLQARIALLSAPTPTAIQPPPEDPKDAPKTKNLPDSTAPKKDPPKKPKEPPPSDTNPTTKPINTGIDNIDD